MDLNLVENDVITLGCGATARVLRECSLPGYWKALSEDGEKTVGRQEIQAVNGVSCPAPAEKEPEVQPSRKKRMYQDDIVFAPTNIPLWVSLLGFLMQNQGLNIGLSASSVHLAHAMIEDDLVAGQEMVKGATQASDRKFGPSRDVWFLTPPEHKTLGERLGGGVRFEYYTKFGREHTKHVLAKGHRIQFYNILLNNYDFVRGKFCDQNQDNIKNKVLEHHPQHIGYLEIGL